MPDYINEHLPKKIYPRKKNNQSLKTIVIIVLWLLLVFCLFCFQKSVDCFFFFSIQWLSLHSYVINFFGILSQL